MIWAFGLDVANKGEVIFEIINKNGWKKKENGNNSEFQTNVWRKNTTMEHTAEIELTFAGSQKELAVRVIVEGGWILDLNCENSTEKGEEDRKMKPTTRRSR